MTRRELQRGSGAVGEHCSWAGLAGLGWAGLAVTASIISRVIDAAAAGAGPGLQPDGEPRQSGGNNLWRWVRRSRGRGRGGCGTGEH